MYVYNYVRYIRLRDFIYNIACRVKEWLHCVMIKKLPTRSRASILNSTASHGSRMNSNRKTNYSFGGKHHQPLLVLGSLQKDDRHSSPIAARS